MDKSFFSFSRLSRFVRWVFIYSGILGILEDPIKDGFAFAYGFVQEGPPRSCIQMECTLWSKATGKVL